MYFFSNVCATRLKTEGKQLQLFSANIKKQGTTFELHYDDAKNVDKMFQIFIQECLFLHITSVLYLIIF